MARPRVQSFAQGSQHQCVTLESVRPRLQVPTPAPFGNPANPLQSTVYLAHQCYGNGLTKAGRIFSLEELLQSLDG